MRLGRLAGYAPAHGELAFFDPAARVVAEGYDPPLATLLRELVEEVSRLMQ